MCCTLCLTMSFFLMCHLGFLVFTPPPPCCLHIGYGRIAPLVLMVCVLFSVIFFWGSCVFWLFSLRVVSTKKWLTRNYLRFWELANWDGLPVLPLCCNFLKFKAYFRLLSPLCFAHVSCMFVFKTAVSLLIRFWDGLPVLPLCCNFQEFKIYCVLSTLVAGISLAANGLKVSLHEWV